MLLSALADQAHLRRLLMARRCAGSLARATLLAALCAGCSDEPGDVPAVRPSALFEVPGLEPGSDGGFYALPFPNDLRVRADGTVDLDDWPRLNTLIERWADIIGEQQRGFGVSSPVYFRLSTAIEPGSLPASPDQSSTDEAAAYLVNVDGASPHQGERVPVLWRFESEADKTIGPNWLALMPYPGFPLREATTYAAVLTTRLLASDGHPLVPSSDFGAIAAATAPSEPHLLAAQQAYEPLFRWLDEPGGDERADVVAAAVFTTQRCSPLMGKLREAAASLPAPEVTELSGPLGSTSPYHLFEGSYTAPNFIAGEVPYMHPNDGGDVQLGDDGMPIVQRMEPMRFALAVPPGDAPSSGWPLVLFAHGTGGDYLSFVNSGVADALTARGLAVVGIDQVLHGPRSDGTKEQLTFFNVENPKSARDSWLQGAVDNVSLARAMLTLHGEAIGSQATAALDEDRILFMGHSQGGLTGVPFLAHDPIVKGAVLSGSYAVSSLAFAKRTDSQSSALIRLVLQDPELDEFSPVLAMMQMWVDRSDSACHGSLLREATGAGGRKSLFLSEGFDDPYSSQEGIEALGTALGLDQVDPIVRPVEGLALRGSQVLQPPVSDNRDGTTAVLLQYREGPERNGHFVLFDLPEATKQYAEFLRTVAYEGVGTVVVP